MIDPAAERILQERFGKDSVIALATLDGGQPSARFVNAYYEDGAFYVITHAHSGKMRQIAQNPAVGIAADWFTAHGVAENLGYLFAPENAAMAAKQPPPPRSGGGGGGGATPPLSRRQLLRARSRPGPPPCRAL